MSNNNKKRIGIKKRKKKNMRNNFTNFSKKKMKKQPLYFQFRLNEIQIIVDPVAACILWANFTYECMCLFTILISLIVD